MKNIFNRLSKNNLHLLLINFIIIIVVYNFMIAHLKNAPIKSQEINGIRYTLIGGYKNADKKFYFKLSLTNISNEKKYLRLTKPFLKFIIERDETQVYETDFSDYYSKPADISISFNKGEQKEFIKHIGISDLKLEAGKYKLVAILFNPEKYQIFSDFKIANKK